MRHNRKQVKTSNHSPFSGRARYLRALDDTLAHNEVPFHQTSGSNPRPLCKLSGGVQHLSFAPAPMFVFSLGHRVEVYEGAAWTGNLTSFFLLRRRGAAEGIALMIEQHLTHWHRALEDATDWFPQIGATFFFFQALRAHLNRELWHVPEPN